MHQFSFYNVDFSMTVVTRFAPSPTGNLQLGNIRTALLTYLFARHQNGKFFLRIDDTDLERSKDEYTESIKRDLTWLGMTWDDYRHQRGREAVYDAARDKLIASGRLYPCYETEDELALKRKSALGRGLPPIYDRAALKLTDEQKAAYEAEGRKPHYRFLLEHKPIIWQDLIRGKVEFHGKDMSDPVLIREDGTALYHLGSVVDDIEYGMTHIVRGEDHVSNTACHVQMFEALGATPPTFAHLPLVFDADGKKLSKRIGSLSIETLRTEEGLEPITIAAFLARLGTSDPIEPFKELTALIKQFDFSRFSRSNPRFMDDELFRLNAKILHQMEYAEAKPRLDAMGLSDLDEDFWIVARANINRFKDIAQWWQVAKGPVTPVIEDADFAAQALSLLPAGPWDSTTWTTWVDAIKAATGRTGKNLFMPLRQALTGMNHGPDMPHLLLLLGYDTAKSRLQGQAV
jgi:glutamyl-tRNA synthetase